MNDKELDEILDDLNLRHFAKGRKDLLPELLIAKKQLKSLLKQAELEARRDELEKLIGQSYHTEKSETIVRAKMRIDRLVELKSQMEKEG